MMPTAIASDVCSIQDETDLSFHNFLPKASRLSVRRFLALLNVNVYIQTRTTLVQVLRTCQEQTSAFVLVNWMHPSRLSTPAYFSLIP